MKKLIKKVTKYIILPMLVYLLVLIIFALSNSFSIITGYSNETMLNFLGSILTTIIAILGGYLISQTDKFENDKKELQLTEKILRVYLAEEIRINADITCVNFVKERLEKEIKKEEKIQHGFNENVTFLEFEKLKFRLLDYETEIGNLVISLYSFLYRINQKKDYKYFERVEVEEFITTYDKIMSSLDK